jgi:opacity protein-like surface antigen
LKHYLILTALLLLVCIGLSAQNNTNNESFAGIFSLGTRNTVSMFNDDHAIGKGIGGQFRIQLKDRLSTEWYFDYITSKNGSYTFRNDYHIGWSVMLYTKNNFAFDHLLQPYLIAGHCFDYSKVSEQNNKTNFADRLSMATQAGLGTHINITQKLDCSLSGQYMLHFGKDIQTTISGDEVVIGKKNFSQPDGHLLFSLSFNYKFFHLW